MQWTTIGLSAGTQNALTPEEAAPQPRDWKKLIASIWIPAVLGLGLLLAFAYVGVRIVAGKSQPGTTSITTKPPVIAPPAATEQPHPAPPSPAPKPASTTINATNFTVVTPQAGERYLQVAAVTPHMVLTYVDSLRKTNLEAVVAPGPTPDLLRVLVGPFSDRDSLDKAKAQLEAAGKHPFLRDY